MKTSGNIGTCIIKYILKANVYYYDNLNQTQTSN